MTNTSSNDELVENFSSQIAEKMYSKIKPDIDTLKDKPPERITKRIIKMQPRVYSNKRIKREKKEDIINEDLYKTAIDHSKYDMLEDEEEEEEAADEEAQASNDDKENNQLLSQTLSPIKLNESKSGKKKVSIANWSPKTETFQIKVGENNRSYVVPPNITKAAFLKIQQLVSHGSNTDNILKYMEEEGLTNLRQMISAKKKTKPNNIISKERNRYYEALNKTNANQQGQGQNFKTGLLNDFKKNE